MPVTIFMARTIYERFWLLRILIFIKWQIATEEPIITKLAPVDSKSVRAFKHKRHKYLNIITTIISLAFLSIWQPSILVVSTSVNTGFGGILVASAVTKLVNFY